MEDLLDFAEVKNNHEVLDLGCGSGETSKAIANRLTNGFLLLLDNSPAMVHKAEENMGNQNRDRVDWILADARESQMLYGKYKEKKFDRIISHCSFHHFVDTTHPVETLARRWKRYLKLGGEVVIAVHNSFIRDCPRPNRWEEWEDPLRTTLAERAKEKNIGRMPSQANIGHMFTSSEIEQGFTRAGFTCNRKRSEKYNRTFSDRVSMWRAPAVHGVLVNLSSPNYDPDEVQRLLDEIHGTIRNEVNNDDSMPTTIFFYRFSVKQERDVEFNATLEDSAVAEGTHDDSRDSSG